MVNEKKIAQIITELLLAVGEDLNRDGLKDTPKRVARLYKELLAGYAMDPKAELNTTFEASHEELVLVKDIYFASLCEHHIIPFFGRAHVGYIPNENGKILGLSKIARMVSSYSHRLQVQERLTVQIADGLEEILDPKGVFVVLEAEHLCMSIRGVRKPGALTITSAVRGIFRENHATRAEVLNLLRG